eukprot:scaffold63165_cov69-Phaeocystis_antarctica.AAC.4
MTGRPAAMSITPATMASIGTAAPRSAGATSTKAPSAGSHALGLPMKDTGRSAVNEAPLAMVASSTVLYSSLTRGREAGSTSRSPRSGVASWFTRLASRRWRKCGDKGSNSGAAISTSTRPRPARIALRTDCAAWSAIASSDRGTVTNQSGASVGGGQSGASVGGEEQAVTAARRRSVVGRGSTAVGCQESVRTAAIVSMLPGKRTCKDGGRLPARRPELLWRCEKTAKPLGRGQHGQM